MTEPAPPLPWLKAFEVAARRLSFTAAGEELGLTQAAISQQIKLLEARLGTTLFIRLPKGVALTAQGAAYLPHVQSAFALISRSTGELFGPRSGRTITLSSPISFTSLWLAPRLAAFGADLPGVHLAISTIHLPQDYDRQTADLDIRFGTGSFAGRISHRLTSERLVPVASPGMARGFTTWNAAVLLSVAGAREMWPDWFALAGLPPPPRARHSFDSFIAAFEAARAGAGILLGSRPLVDPALHDGTLAVLSDVELQSDAGHFVTYPAGASLDYQQKGLVDWLVRQANPPRPHS